MRVEYKHMVARVDEKSTSEKKFWLMKSEPDCYSIDDLKRDKRGSWDGVRNYQARNFMRDEMQVGDLVLFYHSSCSVPGIVGLAEVCREGYPDHTAWNKKSEHPDPKSTKENPVWYMVDVCFKKKFKEVISLEQLKSDKRFTTMKVVQRGQRLSVQPVSRTHFDLISTLAK